MTTSGRVWHLRWWPVLAVLLVLCVALTSAQASISLKSVSTNSSAESSISVDKPADVAASDLLLAQVVVLGGSGISITPPDGWALVRRDDRTGDIGSAIYTLLAGAEEPASYTWTFSAATSANAAIVAYSGVSPSAVVASAGAVGNSASVTAPQVTAEDGCKLVAFFCINRDTTLSTPDGMAEVFAVQAATSPRSSKAADQDVAAGATGSRVSTAGASGRWVAQQVALRADVAPTAPTSVVISPDAPVTDDDLTTTASGGTDESGEPTYVYEWASSTDGENWSEWGNAGQVLSKDLTTAGEQWKARACSFDGISYSDWVESAPVTIGNSDPTAPTSVVISPDAPVTADDLTATAEGASDPDGGEPSYVYEWASSLDGENWSDWGNAGQVLGNDLTTAGEQWKARACATDGTASSDWVESAPVTIGNSAPTAPTAVGITPAEPLDSDDLTASASGGTDPDGGEPGYVFEWASSDDDGANWSDWGNQGQVLGKDLTSPGQQWKVRACSYDGTAPSDWVESAAVTIAADSPVAPDPDAYEADDTSSAAKVIAAGEIQDRTIHAVDNLDFAKFTLAERSDVTIETAGAAGDTEMWVYGTNGAMVGYDNDSGTDSFSLIQVAGLAAGTYFIRVQEANDQTIAAYTLALTATAVAPPDPDAYEVDDTSAAAKVISGGAVQNRNIHAAGNRDWAKFTLSGPSAVTVTSSDNTCLWLYSASGAQLGYNAGSGISADIEAPFLAAGTYFIRVQGRGNSVVEAYTLQINVVALATVTPDAYEVDDTSAAAKSISGGASQSRNIHAVGNVDWARFNVLEPATVTVTATGNTQLWLYRSSGQLVQSAPGNGTLAGIGPMALSPGTYFIRVQARAGTVDAYSLNVTIAP